MIGLLAQLLRGARRLADDTCRHQPRCPDALAADRAGARAVASHPEQGWSLLCNGVISFDDGGILLPGGRAVAPCLHTATWSARLPERERRWSAGNG